MNRLSVWIICLTLVAAGCGRSDSTSRTAAERVLERGGTVTLKGLTVPVRKADKLPAGSFGIWRIDLKERPVTDADLEQLQGLAQLEELNLQDAKGVTDAGLVHLQGLKRLRELSLYRTRVTDAGLASLAGLKSLTKLDLGYTSVTDAGLDQLIGLKNLKSLALYGTRVTKAGIDKLKQALPELTINR